MKICGTCKIEKEISQFYNNPRTKDGYYSRCKPCYRQSNRENYHKNGHKWIETSKNAHVQRNYGISLAQYNEILVQQNSCCPICNKHRDEQKNDLSVDHDHETGKVRGLLCTNCNHRLIANHRDPQIFLNAARYLTNV